MYKLTYIDDGNGPPQAERPKRKAPANGQDEVAYNSGGGHLCRHISVDRYGEHNEVKQKFLCCQRDEGALYIMGKKTGTTLKNTKDRRGLLNSESQR